MDGTPFGRYQLIELLGRGGMGEVWRAHDTTIDRVVALKMLLPHYAKDEDFDKRFRREARTAARLDDPHVVPIYDVGEIDGRLYVTMRLIKGVDLDTLLKTGPLDPRRAVHIIEQIAGALHSAHQAGLVHRDVKPSNILLADNDFAYLIDFGIARAADDTKLTSEGSTIGTWAYMAPERFNTPGDIQPSSDIYALACVLFQCLTGEPPFPGNTLEQVAVGHMVAPPPRASELTESVPPGLDRVIETGLAKQTAERYPTAVEMAAAARRAITEPTSQQASVPTRLDPVPVSHSSPSWPAAPPPMQTPPPGHAPYMYPPTPPGQFSAPNLQIPPAPPVPKRKGRHRGVLIGAAVFVVTLIVAGSVAAVIGLTQRGDSNAAKPPPAAGGADFNGTYRADMGPGTDLDGKPVPNAPATTSSWGVRSTCGAGGCMATAANISDGGVALLSNLTFDQIGGTWVAVGLASAQCGGDKPDELWVVYTLQPQPDGTLTGETVRASTNSACAAKRSVKFTRTGDPDLNKVPDPSVLPQRVANTADALRGSYRQTTTFTNGQVVRGKVLEVNTYCLRTGDRCMSLFHADGEAVTLMFANDKWTRNEQGVATCGGGGTAPITITAEYPMPPQLDDPIALLTGRGTATVAAGGACTGGGDFEDEFRRTGD